MVHPNQGQQQGDADRAFEPAGNRPAQNARQATPGSVLSQTKVPNQAATDFLGLGEQVAPAAQTTPGDLLWQAQQPAPDPEDREAPEEAEEIEAPVARDPHRGHAEDEGDEIDEASSEGVHRSWVDDSPAVRSRRMLPKVALAVGLGMAAMTGLLVMQNQGGDGFDEPAPLSPEMNATPGYEERLLEGAPPRGARAPVTEAESLEGEQVAVLDQPSELEGSSAEVEAQPEARETETASAFEAPLASEGATFEEPAPSLPLFASEDPSAADAEAEPSVEGLAEHSATTRASVVAPTSLASTPRRAGLRPIWEQIGETPPPSPLSGFAIAAPPAGDASAAEALEPEVRTLVVVGDDAGESSLEDHPYWAERSADERAEPAATSVEAEDDASSAPVAAGEAEAVPSEPLGEPLGELAGAPADASPIETAPALPVAEVSPAAPSSVPSSGAEAGFFGPILPAGSAPVVVEPTADGDEEVTSNVRVRRLDPSQVVEPDQRGPRMANASELKGVWLQEAVPPMWTIQEAQKVLTPQVGQVRVILEGNEIFQGRLYAMGEGRVWINNERFGQMGLEGPKVQKILRIDADDDSPVPGESGSENLGGLESVRVKTPGGVLFGKVIARDEEHTTIVTEDGTRVTLASDQVEFLNEAPTVALKRAREPNPESQPAAEKQAEGEIRRARR